MRSKNTEWLTKTMIEEMYHISRRTTDRCLRKIRDAKVPGAIRTVGGLIQIEHEIVKQFLKVKGE